MKNNDVVTRFRATFNKVRRELAKTSGCGFGFSGGANTLRDAFRVAMIDARVPATPGRIAMVNTWVQRACGGAA